MWLGRVNQKTEATGSVLKLALMRAIPYQFIYQSWQKTLFGLPSIPSTTLWD